jgi:hypothetical protein
MMPCAAAVAAELFPMRGPLASATARPGRDDAFLEADPAELPGPLLASQASPALPQKPHASAMRWCSAVTLLQKKTPHHFLDNAQTFDEQFHIFGDPSGILDWRSCIVDAHFFVDGISAVSGSERLGRSVVGAQKSTRIKSQTRVQTH